MQIHNMFTECTVFRGKNIEIPESRVPKKQEKRSAPIIRHVYNLDRDYAVFLQKVKIGSQISNKIKIIFKVIYYQ